MFGRFLINVDDIVDNHHQGVGWREKKTLVFAAALGSVLECYDFWIYALMTPFLAPLFFPGDPVVQMMLSLAAMTMTSFSRPVGGLIFGYIGDRFGRKVSFLITLLLMGISTFSIGLLPTYQSIGISASILIVLLRACQGIALGGEFSGASIYVAEQSSYKHRGFFTSIIQSTSGLGAAFTSFVLFVLHFFITKDEFKTWGWRVPFLLSAIIFLVSLISRAKLEESTVFQKMKQASSISKAPLREALFQWKNLKWILLVFACIMFGESSINQTDYVIFLLLVKVLSLNSDIANLLLIYVYLLQIPVLIYMGHLSDKFGRKKMMIGAFILTILTYAPLMKGLVYFSDPMYSRVIQTHPVTVHYKPSDQCQFGFLDHLDLSYHRNDISRLSECQKTIRFLANHGIDFTRDESGFSGQFVTVAQARVNINDRSKLQSLLKKAGYEHSPSTKKANLWGMVFFSFLLMIPSAIVSGALGSALMELFPARIRYTSMSLVYNLGHGFLGGLAPIAVMSSVLHFGSIYAASFYTLVTTAVSLAISVLFYPKKIYI